MMKLALFVFLAVVAYASAGVISVPSAFSAEGVNQIHSPWAVSSSSRVQTFNDAAIVAPVPVAVPHISYAAPIASYAAPIAPISPYAAYASPLAYY